MSKKKDPLEIPAELQHLISNELTKNYELLRKQTGLGFKITYLFMAFGFLIVLTGSLGKLFGYVLEGTDLAIIAGILLEFISGTALLVYRTNSQRLNSTSDKLLQYLMWLIIIEKIETLPIDKRVNITVNSIIPLIEHTRITGDRAST